MEIEADYGAADGKAFEQDAGDELFGGEICERAGECEHNGAVEAGSSEEPQLRSLGREPEQPLLRMKENARMRLEGQDGGRLPQRRSLLACDSDDGPMAAVDPVKIADGDNSAA